MIEAKRLQLGVDDCLVIRARIFVGVVAAAVASWDFGSNLRNIVCGCFCESLQTQRSNPHHR